MVAFAAVVSEGGFGRAAAALGVSKSHVSKQVSRLEDSLGVRLLVRTTRSVRLTDVGEQYYERCVELLRVAADASSLAGALQSEPVGHLRVSLPVGFAHAALKKPIAEYLDRYPRVHARIDVTNRAVDLVREGIDVAIRVGPVHDPELVVRRLATARHVLVASPAYLERRGRPREPEDLGAHECLLFSLQARADRWVFHRDGRAHEIRVAGRVRMDDGAMLAAAAVAGLGLAWLPEFLVREQLRTRALIAVLDDRCKHTTDISAVLPARKHVPVKVRALIEVVEQALG